MHVCQKSSRKPTPGTQSRTDPHSTASLAATMPTGWGRVICLSRSLTEGGDEAGHFYLCVASLVLCSILLTI